MENGEKTAARLEALTAGGDAEELANQLDVISNREIRADQRHPWQDVTAKGADMLRSQAGQIAKYREALIRMVKYADWQIAEGVDHHPTLPSAIEEARALITGARD